MSVLLCSDLHLGHETAAKLRGFDSVAEHDHTIIAMLQMQCTKRTLLWVLGDVAMKVESLALLQDVPGEKRLVRGNHDGFQDDVYHKYFTYIHGFLRYKKTWLSHCPIHPQEMYRCEANVHGHIHYTTYHPQPKFPYINVNWDFWERAVHLDEIRQWVIDRYVPYERRYKHGKRS